MGTTTRQKKIVRKKERPAAVKASGKALRTAIHNQAVGKPLTGSNTKKSRSKTVLPKAGKKAPMPQNLQPMLATLVDAPFDDAGWTYEIKWDGFRAVAYLHNGRVELRSRNNKSFNEKFYPVYEGLKKWTINAVLDGEIVVVNESGISNFSDLQNWRSEADGQ